VPVGQIYFIINNRCLLVITEPPMAFCFCNFFIFQFQKSLILLKGLPPKNEQFWINFNEEILIIKFGTVLKIKTKESSSSRFHIPQKNSVEQALYETRANIMSPLNHIGSTVCIS
jgi:hypothetical protein